MFSEYAKNKMLDALSDFKISLHSGDPGAAGTNNEISGDGYARQNATFGAASSGERSLSAQLDFSGPDSASVTHIGVWESGGPDVFLASAEITGATAFNALGEFSLVAAKLVQGECEGA